MMAQIFLGDRGVWKTFSIKDLKKVALCLPSESNSPPNFRTGVAESCSRDRSGFRVCGAWIAVEDSYRREEGGGRRKEEVGRREEGTGSRE